MVPPPRRHRALRPYEPALHLVLISLAGAPILLGLFLEINAPFLVVMILGFLAHEAIGSIDLSWATHRRGVPRSSSACMTISLPSRSHTP